MLAASPRRASIEKRITTLAAAGLLIACDIGWRLSGELLDRASVREKLNDKREQTHSIKLDVDCLTAEQRRTVTDIKDFLNLTGSQIFKYIYNGNEVLYRYERILLLTQELGFDEELLPKKYNKGVPLTHIEEYIIDTRNVQGRELYCKSSREMICRMDERTGLVIIHIDKATANVATQLMSLIERYRPLLNMGRIPISFLSVVDSKKREYSYAKAVERIMKQQLGVQDKLIRLHTHILRNRLGEFGISIKRSKMDGPETFWFII